ncbi:MAG: hypothetical protein ABR923_11265 [Terracidiphilus sp.]|jgi:hypothetical protein
MNSSIEIIDSLKLAHKLIDRTRDGKVTWEVSVSRNLLMALTPADLSEATSFYTTLEGNLRAEVSLIQEPEELFKFSLVESFSAGGTLLSGMILNPDKEILSVSIEKDPSFGFDSPSEKELNKALVDLYSLARRSALKIEGSVQKALTYLDKLAV